MRLWWPATPRGLPPSAAAARGNPIFIALDLGGTSLRGLCVDSGGRTVSEQSQRARNGTADEALGQLLTMIQQLVPQGSKPAALGVSVAAAPNPRSGRLTSIANIQGLKDVDLGAELGRRLVACGWPCPIMVANDAELSAVAEGRLGAAVGLRDFVSITIGTGIGMGVVLDGSVLRGWRGMAGELAFLPVRGMDVPQDEAGAFEGLVAGRTMVARAVAEIAASAQAAEATRLERGTTMATALELAAAGDPAAGRLIERECRYLAVGIATVAALIDPQLVVLSGGIGSQPGLAAPVRRAVAAILSEPPPIETSALGERAPLLGALEAARDAARDQLGSDETEPASIV